VVRVLSFSAVVAVVVAWAVASIISRWEAHHQIGNYWLLPISNTRFWFFLFYPGAVAVHNVLGAPPTRVGL